MPVTGAPINAEAKTLMTELQQLTAQATAAKLEFRAALREAQLLAKAGKDISPDMARRVAEREKKYFTLSTQANEMKAAQATARTAADDVAHRAHEVHAATKGIHGVQRLMRTNFSDPTSIV